MGLMVSWVSLGGSWVVGGATIIRISLGGCAWLNDAELASLDMAGGAKHWEKRNLAAEKVQAVVRLS